MVVGFLVHSPGGLHASEHFVFEESHGTPCPGYRGRDRPVCLSPSNQRPAAGLASRDPAGPGLLS